MIKYNLVCKCGKKFESWFSGSSEYDLLKRKKLINCIESTKFNLLKKKENEYGFPENISMNHEKKVDFFNLGPENKWEKKLSKGVLLEANNIFKEDLKFLKY